MESNRLLNCVFDASLVPETFAKPSNVNLDTLRTLADLHFGVAGSSAEASS